ncbi:MAG: HAD family phosphatase [Ginsengibacter sp.]
MQKLEAVIFDLGGVILNIDYHLTRKAFEELGVKNFNEMYSQAAADKLFKRLETGNIKEAQFHFEFNSCIGLQLKKDAINKAWNAMLLNFREESLFFLDQIKSRYRLFLLSNTNEIHYRMFNSIYYKRNRHCSFEDFFEKAYYSFEMGMRKPDGNIYQYVVERNNLEYGSTLFIDDSIQNVEAAKILGMQTVLLKTDGSIENLGL